MNLAPAVKALDTRPRNEPFLKDLAPPTCSTEKISPIEEVEHLIVLQHGLHGNPNDWRYFKQVLAFGLSSSEGESDEESRGNNNKIHVHVSTQNAQSYFTTHDGIDAGGLRLAEEILDLVNVKFHRLKYFSILGHSLGGLYIRYAIGVLLAREFFKTICPLNFICFATPHLGLWRPERGVVNKLFNAMSPTVSQTLFRRTGSQLTLTDRGTESAMTKALRRRQSSSSREKGVNNVASFELTGDLWCSVGTFVNEEPFNLRTCHIQNKSLRIDSIQLGLSLEHAHCQVCILPDRTTQLNVVCTHTATTVCFRWHSTSSGSCQISLEQWILGLSIAGCVCHGITSNDDDDDPHQPLLVSLTQGSFVQALRLFQSRSCYANVFRDFQVHYSTSAVRSFNPYRGCPTGCPTSSIYSHLSLTSLPEAHVKRQTYRHADMKVHEEKNPRNRQQTHGRHRKQGRQEILLERLRRSVIQQSRKQMMMHDDDEHAMTMPNTLSRSSSRTKPKALSITLPNTNGDHQYLMDPIQEAFGSISSLTQRRNMRSMLVSLQSLSWRRMDVVFHRGVMSHEKIIAKRANLYPPQESGIDIPVHVADTFLTQP